MKYKPTIWLFMTSRLKKGLATCWPREDVKKLLVKAKPIYKDILSRMKGISDNNHMAGSIAADQERKRRGYCGRCHREICFGEIK
ncbi:MAG: hypothetical protein IKQ56_08150 [Lachnospiraceae bacterium]|nr:hypothetical protein [Lachnospiraceae bacterium]